MRHIIIKIGTQGTERALHLTGKLCVGGTIGIKRKGDSWWTNATKVHVDAIDKSAGEQKCFWLIRVSK